MSKYIFRNYPCTIVSEEDLRSVMVCNIKEKDDLKKGVDRLLRVWKNQSLDGVVNLSVIDAVEDLERIINKQRGLNVTVA